MAYASYETPLVPKHKVRRPPWHPVYLDYNGRIEWWAELGFKDEELRRGKLRLAYQSIKENNCLWFDEKVPDGTSVIGSFGLDSKYHPDLTKKGDQPMNFFDFQKKVRETSAQYKQIAEKWKLSEEHPGLAVNPNLSSIYKPDSMNLATFQTLPHQFIQYHLGPRFWDKPINEGCVEKGLALAKYSVPTSLVLCLLMEKGKNQTKELFYPQPRFKLLKIWARNYLPLPALLAFTFGISACTAATIRNQDDAWNWTIASTVCGFTLASIGNNNIIQGMTLAGVLSFFAFFYQMKRIHVQGVQGGQPPLMYSGGSPHMSPIAWKHIGLYNDPSVFRSGITQTALPKC